MKPKEPYTIGVKTIKEILMCKMTEDEKDAYIKHLQTEIAETKKRLFNPAMLRPVPPYSTPITLPW